MPHNCCFAGAIRLQGLSTHLERIDNVKLSHEIPMPTSSELRDLVAQQNTEIDCNDTLDRETFEVDYTKGAYFWPGAAQDAGAQVNGKGGIYVGLDHHDREIWAVLVSSHADLYVCDAPHRALVLFWAIEDGRSRSGRGTVYVSSLIDIAHITRWHSGIVGNNAADRFKFIYDALVEAAQAEAM